jgi:alpha-beta hydrolase superfamily lysophospholipase
VQEAPAEDVPTHLYPGARHEVLNETNRDQVIQHLAHWIDRISPPTMTPRRPS